MRHHSRRHPSRRQSTQGPSERVAIQLLGRFEVSVDGAISPARGWTRRTAAALVKVLALAPGHRLHREQVIDILWPDDSPEAAAPKLHKAAHYARRASGRDDAVVLRNDVVQLFPQAELTVDVVIFEELSRRAIADRDPVAARAAIDHYPGELLPDDRYEDWAGERRELLRLRHLNLLRLARKWFEVTEHDPGDEQAHVELMRDHVANGDCRAALLQYDVLEGALDRHLGVAPGSTARELRDHINAGNCEQSTDLPARLSMISGVVATPPAWPHRRVEDLIAELADLTRRQASLLEELAGAGIGSPSTTFSAAS